MSDIVKILPYSVDMGQTIEKTELHTLFVMGDKEAHRFELEVSHGIVKADLTDCTVMGYFTNFKEKTTIQVDGKAEGSKAIVTLSRPCYALHGQFVLTIQIKSGDVEASIFMGEGYMRTNKAEKIVYEDYVVYDVDTLLAQIAEMKTATKDAQDAASAATTAASKAPYIDPISKNWMIWNAATGKYVDSGITAQGEPGPQGPPGQNSTDGSAEIDATLTQEGKAADAKATGDALGQLSEQKADCIRDMSAKAASHTLHVQDGALHVTLHGKTTETGTGEKSPENPYTISGVSAAKVHVGGKNLFDISKVYSGYTIDGNRITMKTSGYARDLYTATQGTAAAVPVEYLSNLPYIAAGKYMLSWDIETTNSSKNLAVYAVGEDGSLVSGIVSGGRVNDETWNLLTVARPTRITLRRGGNTEATYSNIMLTPCDEVIPYEPYNANTADIPLLPDGAPLYGNGTVDDTVENDVIVDGERKCKVTRRWGVIDSYAGESITTEYVSSTGSLDEGAKVVYKLVTPEVYYTDKHELRKPSGIMPVTVTGSGETSVEYPHDTKDYIDKKTEIPEDSNVDLLTVYPVGSIYMSANETSPASVFGGEWEQIKGRFLIGTGAPENNDDGSSPGDYNMALGSKGGEATHKLTIDEMPSHRHGVGLSANAAAAGNDLSRISSSGTFDSSVCEARGGDKAHNNMPPYLTVYMWKRVS